MLRRISEGGIVPPGLCRAHDGALILRLPLLTWRCTRTDWSWGERIEGWWTLNLRLTIAPYLARRFGGGFRNGVSVSWGAHWVLDLGTFFPEREWR